MTANTDGGKMADKTKEQAEQQDGPKKRNKILLIIIVVATILIIGVGAAAYFAGVKNATPASVPPPVEENKADSTTAKQSEDLGPMVPVDEFLINLLDKETNRYLKATMTLEVDSQNTLEEIQTRMPQIRDAILLHTSNKTFNELRDLQGKMQLRTELTKQINTLLNKGEVKHIYITNFVIQ